jgi:hypothetical protein
MHSYLTHVLAQTRDDERQRLAEARQLAMPEKPTRHRLHARMKVWRPRATRPAIRVAI